jgi:16S rRNA (uracil1498-N3)-methyltransferase
MSRFYVPPEKIKGDLIHVDGKEARHILTVMRMSEGDRIVLFDGEGNEYTGFIRDAATDSGRELTVEVIKAEKPLPRKRPDIILAQALPKKARMDHIVQKATELGAAGIIPVITERTVPRPDGKKSAKRLARWRKIAVEAAKQCGRAEVPDIPDIVRYADLAGDLDGYDLVVMASLMEGNIPIKQVVRGYKKGRILVCIGPEGDFTPEEAGIALKAPNCRPVSLGRRVLKSDTAGLYVLSVLGYELDI